MQTSQAASTHPFGTTQRTWGAPPQTAQRLKCAVTGGTGFVGRHLVEALVRRGDQVCCVARSSSNLKSLEALGVEVRRAELGDQPALKRALAGADCVFHVAGITKAFRAAEYDAVNRDATERLLSACVDRETPPRIVLVSSLAAAGPSTVDRPRIEGEPSTPVSQYGRSKLAGEVTARQFAAWAPISLARPPMVFGPGERDVFAIAQSIARTGIHFVPGWRTRRYSLVHVQDLAEGLIRVAEAGSSLPQPGATPSEGAQGVYYLADAAMPTYSELGQMMGRALGREPLVVVLPPRAMVVAAGFNAVWGRIVGRPAALNLDKAREGLAGSWTCDPSLAERDLGWKTAAPLEQRIFETIAWCRAQGWVK